MIRLNGLTKDVGIGNRRQRLFDDVRLDIPSNERIALLGRHSAGKSLLLLLLAGLEEPTSGDIERYARVSLPIGYGRAFKITATAIQNAEFLARCYGADPDEVVEFVNTVADIEEYQDIPLRMMPADMRVRFAFTLTYALPFDVYLIDNSAMGGSPEFRDRCAAMLNSRLQNAGIIYATNEPRIAKRFCTSALVIHDRKLIYTPSLDDGLALLEGASADVESAER